MVDRIADFIVTCHINKHLLFIFINTSFSHVSVFKVSVSVFSVQRKGNILCLKDSFVGFIVLVLQVHRVVITWAIRLCLV